jgi:subtilisin family serine protease
VRIGLPPFVQNYLLTAQAAGEAPAWWREQLRIDQQQALTGGTLGEGVIVGVVDTGVSPVLERKGEDLHGRILAGADFSGSAPRKGYADDHNHGTGVCSLIAGDNENGKGVAGVAPKAKICIAKGLGRGGVGSAEGIAAAIHWLADECHVHLINLSLGSDGEASVITQAVVHALEKGVTIIAAAGNSGANAISYPAMLPPVISVAATDTNRQPAVFTSPSKVDVAAPGVDIIVDDRFGQCVSMSGTSFAAPIVAGIVALIFGEYLESGKPLPSPAEVSDMLGGTADDIYQPGHDLRTGFGLVDGVEYLHNVAASVKPPAGNGETSGVSLFIPGAKVLAG